MCKAYLSPSTCRRRFQKFPSSVSVFNAIKKSFTWLNSINSTLKLSVNEGFAKIP